MSVEDHRDFGQVFKADSRVFLDGGVVRFHTDVRNDAPFIAVVFSPHGGERLSADTEVQEFD